MARSPRERVAADLETIAAVAIAGAAVSRALMKALRERGLISESDLVALAEDAAQAAIRNGQSNPRLARLIAQEIRQYLDDDPAALRH